MAKQGMKRPERTHTKPENEAAAVPEIQGKAKSGKRHVRAIIAGTVAPEQKVYHTKPYSKNKNKEKPISDEPPQVVQTVQKSLLDVKN